MIIYTNLTKIMTSENYKNIANKIKFEGRAFINGKYVDAVDGKKFETINPATGDVLCSVAQCNACGLHFF